MNTRDKNIFGLHDEKTLKQLEDVATRADRVALMSDGHLGYVMPIGGVAAYDNKVSVSGVGFDIACGNAAIRTDKTLADMKNTLPQLADEIAKIISFGVGRKNTADDAPVHDPLFGDAAWEVVPSKGGARQRLLDKARSQLGTVGSGNHYVDVFADEAGAIWVGVHFGSRGFGHTVASSFMALHQGGAPLEPRLLIRLDQEVLTLSLRHLQETLLGRNTPDINPVVEHIASLLELSEDQGRLAVLENHS